ncbi:uncharacterized protein CDAR_450631 [Caerostris darwini]|uniref:Uncharacterized protein n=1 Tax=Caerostris darwini TaxID=1538125 RepID=A0AAV4P876_9ARAC|nr:uncharacterized protein CDAR_450631 [Caerostris darwini]
MHEKMCLFNKCSGPPKWKIYGISSKKTVLYYDLLRQKGQFQHFLQMNEFQISKHKKISCCIIDKSNLPSQGRGVNIFIFDTSEQYHSALYLEYSIHEKFMLFIQNETSLNHDFSLPAINDCEKAILVPSLNKVHSIKKVTDSCSSEQVRSQPEFKHTADLDAFKDITPSLKNKQSPIKQDNYEKAQISTDMKYFSQETITAKTFTGEEYVACSSKSNLPNINFVSFQTAAGKSLKISETALKTAEKIFQEVCAENLDIFPVKDIKRPLKSSQRNKDSNLKEKECVDDDINSILPGSFFDDIPFDEKEIDWKHLDTTINVPVVKSDTANTVQPHKIRKSLGGRRSLKPYTLKK